MGHAAIFLAVSLVLVPVFASAQPCANPGPPTDVAAAVVAQRVVLTWTAPTVPNDCPVTGYWVGIGYEPGLSNASETQTPHTTADRGRTRSVVPASSGAARTAASHPCARTCHCVPSRIRGNG